MSWMKGCVSGSFGRVEVGCSRDLYRRRACVRRPMRCHRAARSIERDGAREAHAVGIECHHGEQAAPLPVQHFIELLQSRRVDVGIGGIEGLEGKLEEACARPGGGHTGNEGGELVAAHFIEDFTGFDALNVGGRHVEFVPFARRTGRQIGVTLDEQCFCRHSFVGD